MHVACAIVFKVPIANNVDSRVTRSALARPPESTSRQDRTDGRRRQLQEVEHHSFMKYELAQTTVLGRDFGHSIRGQERATDEGCSAVKMEFLGILRILFGLPHHSRPYGESCI